jgi:hypothetical protein
MNTALFIIALLIIAAFILALVYIANDLDDLIRNLADDEIGAGRVQATPPPSGGSEAAPLVTAGADIYRREWTLVKSEPRDAA